MTTWNARLIGADAAMAATEREAETILRVATIQVANGVTRRMRVDTGRARGGTQISIGSPLLDDPNRLDKGGATVTAEAVGVAARAVLGDDTFVANAVEYVPFLEDGTSRTVGDFMFALTVEEVVGQFS